MGSRVGSSAAYWTPWRRTYRICAGHGSIFMASSDDFKQANRRAKDMEARIPRAVSASYDRKTGRIVVHLSSNLIVSFLDRKSVV